MQNSHSLLADPNFLCHNQIDTRITDLASEGEYGISRDVLPHILERVPIIHHERLAPFYLGLMRSFDIGSSATRELPELHILTCHNYEYRSLLEVSHDLFDYPVTVLRPADGKWRYDCKITLLLEKLEKMSDNDLFLFADASDVIFKRHPSVATEIFLGQKSKVLFMSGIDRHAYLYMPMQYKWHLKTYGVRVLNSGVFMGYVGHARQLLRAASIYIDTDATEMSKQRLQSIIAGHLKLGKKLGDDNKHLLPGFPRGALDQAIYQYIHADFYPDVDIDIECNLAYRA